MSEAARERPRGPITEMDVYRGMGEGFAVIAFARLAVFVPNVGLQLQRGSSWPASVLSWSGSLPFGPATACKRSARGGQLTEFQPFRVAFEAGVVMRSDVTGFLRPGLRAIWHRSRSPVGVGAGLGSTLTWNGERGAASVSPELLLHYGRCCSPGYLVFSVRADRFHARRQPTSLTATLGVAFW